MLAIRVSKSGVRYAASSVRHSGNPECCPAWHHRERLILFCDLREYRFDVALAIGEMCRPGAAVGRHRVQRTDRGSMTNVVGPAGILGAIAALAAIGIGVASANRTSRRVWS